ncbi:alpha-ribazole-5-phosphate synthase [Sporosarcina sp. ACRSL]|uniref:alpha-ribazole-5-phosphate synthase n=1 Tax=Sporosarcina sp. ACRSL TaxID=2918215 RepID=UPI001EF4273F|nr:alpha-ribazole-5-phosphate synthase [Sporosarcina sp. ACRSL]MCG7343873.1 alpha-ribazole-5-phosphate synthase [Sporosarcina sp. ACRSL]
MRNAILLGDGFVVTTDNSGGIGEKPHDVVTVSDFVTAYFAARVALLEQWAAQAEPVSVIIHNFSGSDSWAAYVKGVEKIFEEAGCELPQVSGSTETNMELMQSAVAVTMIGMQRLVEDTDELEWYVYGTPLVGNEVLERQNEIASTRLIKEAMDTGIVHRMWPVGSKGILSEYRRLTGNPQIEIETHFDIQSSAGPSTSVLLGINVHNIERARQLLGGPLHKITEIDSFRNEI